MRVKLILAAFILTTTTAYADIEEASAYHTAQNGTAMIVIENGEVISQTFANDGGPQKAGPLASGTKSFSSAIAAAAVMDGFLSLDELAADTLVEWRNHPRKSQITIRQILSLSSGIKTPRPGGVPTYADAVALPMGANPGEGFEYGPANFQIFGEIIRRKLISFDGGRYEDASSYLQARVFDPLNVTPRRWTDGADGYPRLSTGVVMTAADWARFGQFILQGGVWDDRKLVDSETLAQSFQESDANAGYGLSWWLNNKPDQQIIDASDTLKNATDLFTNPAAEFLPKDLIIAAGSGDQRLYIVPSMDLVIVRQTKGIFVNFGEGRRSSRERSERRRGERRRTNRWRNRGDRLGNSSNGFSDVEFLTRFFNTNEKEQ